MAKVAAAGPVHPSNSLNFGGSKVTTTTLKRKTPSELRGEQLKRKTTVELSNDSAVPAGGSMSGVIPGPKRSDISKNPRYVDTRVDELFPVRKNSIRLKLVSRKENAKENLPAENSGSIKNSIAPSAFLAENQQRLTCPENGKDHATETCSTSERRSENAFCCVTELSRGSADVNGLPAVDVEKTLRGLASNGHLLSSVKNAESSEADGGSRQNIFCSEFDVPCKAIPLDLTVKTKIQVVSSSSISWFHRLINCSTSNAVARLPLSVNCSTSQRMTCFSEVTSVAQAISPKPLHSWMYPQSPLPPSVISALTLSTSAEVGKLDFLSERQLAWMDSFRSLYYMLRKNICRIFYVCTAQFVVMFTSSCSEENKYACYAYISQSTRNLRSLLQKHDVSFSMPLCDSKVEELSTEELVELSEMQKLNPGQIRRRDAMSDMHNGPQSLLAFTGNKSVHSLYDFLLNYRYFLTSLNGMDVPVLCSPMPFDNAALTVPEVKCKEIRRPGQLAFHGTESNVASEPHQQSSSGMYYCVEIRGRYLGPWVTSAICDAFSSNSTSFEASFDTEPASVGLNTGLKTAVKCSDPKVAATDALDERDVCFGIPNTKTCSELTSASLKGLKYSGGSYTAYLSPV